MIRHALFGCLLLALTTAARGATVTTTFEDQGLAPNSFNNDAGPSGHFTSGTVSLNNTFAAAFDFWSGWAISTKTDSATPGFGNQYSAITGQGAGGSTTYAVAYTFGFPQADSFHPADSLINLPPSAQPVSIDVTNTTYAYFSMLLGDSFSKKFAAGDFFQLDIRGFSGPDGTGSPTGQVNFLLANFLNGNSIIVNDWHTLDLSALAGAQSLRFGLQSSDNNPDPTIGMKTPAYFAVDNFVLTVVPEPSSLVYLTAVAFTIAARCRRMRKSRASWRPMRRSRLGCSKTRLPCERQAILEVGPARSPTATLERVHQIQWRSEFLREKRTAQVM
jgi:hypothetical protein